MMGEELTLNDPEDENRIHLFESLYDCLIAWESAQSRAIEIMNQIEDRYQELKCDGTVYRSGD